MKKNARFYVGLGLISGMYLVLTFVAPLGRAIATYHTSVLQLRALQLSVILPIIIIWTIALWGSLRFKQYAKSIITSKDGKALNWVANGLLLLVFGLAFSSVTQSVQPLLKGSSWFQAWVILQNYIDVATVLLAFSVVYKGAWGLASLVHFKNMGKVQAGVIIAVVSAGIMYAWLLAQNPYRQTSPDISKVVPYYLPDWLLVVSIVIPYLLAWYAGLMAAMSVQLYQRYSAGVIYRRSAKRLSIGLLAIVCSSVLIQVLGAVGPSLSNLGLASILVLLYVLILVYGLGHMLVANGAKQLARLEEVV